MLGLGTVTVLSPDGKSVAALLFGTPMKVAIYPLGTSDSRTLVMGKVVTATISAGFRMENVWPCWDRKRAKRLGLT